MNLPLKSSTFFGALRACGENEAGPAGWPESFPHFSEVSACVSGAGGKKYTLY